MSMTHEFAAVVVTLTVEVVAVPPLLPVAPSGLVACPVTDIARMENSQAENVTATL